MWAFLCEWRVSLVVRGACVLFGGGTAAGMSSPVLLGACRGLITLRVLGVRQWLTSPLLCLWLSPCVFFAGRSWLSLSISCYVWFPCLLAHCTTVRYFQ